MEVGKGKKTLEGLFLRYIGAFCLNAVMLIGAVVLLFSMVAMKGIVLPANYAEKQLQINEETIRNARRVTMEEIPVGCSYGVFDQDGGWLYGNFDVQEREQAWESYEKGRIYARTRGYYRFIARTNGEVCVVKYYLVTRYRSDDLNRILPNPELMMPILYVVFFIAQAVWLAKRFSRKLKGHLNLLNEATGKIAANDLEFEAGHSDIKEVEEVLVSLDHMKEALQESLKKQWDMETQRSRQLGELAHDIKTPLTVIRGNAELLAEENQTTEERECNEYILSGVSEIEGYLEDMRDILGHNLVAENEKVSINCERMKQKLAAQAVRLAKGCRQPIVVRSSELAGEVRLDIEKTMRAWENLVSNALEYTDEKRGIEITARTEKESAVYMVIAVNDYGPGFSEEELLHATQEFYRGDASRHARSHQGLGLAIAKRFMEAQGGCLVLGNSQETGGASAELWIPVVSEKMIVE